MIGALTHDREVTSRKPSWSSRRKWLRAARACAGSRSCNRKNALATKLSASIANTQPVPAIATSTPETAGPKTFIALRERPSSALADWRLPGEIVRGTSPIRRGAEECGGGTEERSRDEEERQRHLMRQQHRRGERLDGRAHAVAREHHRAPR